MNDYNFSDQIIQMEKLLRWLCTSIKRKGRDILTDFEITPPQFDALLELLKNGEMTIGELSSRMFLACSTITDLIDRMEKNSLVERVKDQKDRRVVRIIVLEKGHLLINRVLEERKRYLEHALHDLDFDTKERILTSIRLIQERTEMEYDGIKE